MARHPNSTEIDTLSEQLRDALLARRVHAGHWEGRLAASALSTATAIFAIHSTGEARGGLRARERGLVGRGVEWLVENTNDDGAWGDTIRSSSNLSTTCLCWAALGAIDHGSGGRLEALTRAEAWIEARTGSLERVPLARAIKAVYGKDRTFSVPILSMCALAGRLGEDDDDSWSEIPQLPFEFAALPRGLFRHLGLQVVSYALPALIAIGVLGHRRHRGHAPAAWVRDAVEERTLRLLTAIQPASGGFLEATPLTSFVAMSLGGAGLATHTVVDHCLEFLATSVHEDGSWPIDTNLATWVTTLSVNALAGAPGGLEVLDAESRAHIVEWLLSQQYREPHPYTDAPPGAWAWTNLSGGVPDADDTAGALLALEALCASRVSSPPNDFARVVEAASAGLGWLLDLQNRDGGIPTFCRGWGKLPFDRSSPDLSAHALRAFAAWNRHVDGALRARLDLASTRLVDYLEATQQADGAWRPLWFGNQHAADFENLTYGSSRVLVALEHDADPRSATLRKRGVEWLLETQNEDGGWGGAAGTPSSFDETALALEALASKDLFVTSRRVRDAIGRALSHLEDGVRKDDHARATPIGFYFANLWYYEELYPLIFANTALGRVRALGEPGQGRP